MKRTGVLASVSLTIAFSLSAQEPARQGAGKFPEPVQADTTNHPADRHAPSLAAFRQGDDASSEACYTVICVIQGQSIQVVAYLPCKYYEICGTPHRWRLDSLPPGITASFDPPIHEGFDTATTITIRADTLAVNAPPYQNVRLGADPSPPDWPRRYPIQVLCSLKRGQCGRAEIISR